MGLKKGGRTCDNYKKKKRYDFDTWKRTEYRNGWSSHTNSEQKFVKFCTFCTDVLTGFILFLMYQTK